ncbi:MAG: ATP-binding protein [Jatrophihabitans sp.]
MTESVADGGASTDTVELTVPADPAYVSVLRTVTASLAARRDFTIDEIDDLRIAVDEASALLLPHAGPTGSLTAVFGGSPSALQVLVSVEVTAGDRSEPASLDQTSFAWMVLAALTDDVSTELAGGRLKVTLTKTRGARS